jgi:transposase
MQTVTTVGLDIAKSVFQVHGIDAKGDVIIRRQLKRRYVLAFFQKLPSCLVGIEACASSHHWSRELTALGHTVRLMPPAYVKPYVKRQKNDMADAEAICEAVTRATMRFVPTKTPEQQSCLVVHRARDSFSSLGHLTHDVAYAIFRRRSQCAGHEDGRSLRAPCRNQSSGLGVGALRVR